MDAAAGDLPQRIDRLDWDALSAALDLEGNAVIQALFAHAECDALAALYARADRFRRIALLQEGDCGQGEYKYFSGALPAALDGLRAALYARLAPLANRWQAALQSDIVYPARFERFAAQCRAAGRAQSLCSLSRYVAGDFESLHQEPCGAGAFPFQAVLLLSQPGRDFSGGELVMTEQRPRMQSRPMALALQQGDLALLAAYQRPLRGAGGVCRVSLWHGVSRLHDGCRHALGLVFHDAS